MMNIWPLLLAALVALAVPGLLGYALTRRLGVGGLWLVLAGTAAACVAIWMRWQTPSTGWDSTAGALTLVFLILPGIVGIGIGAAMGLARNRR